MKTTQQNAIYQYCQQHGSITAREAFIKLDINSPRKVISDMRDDGYDVDSITEQHVNAYGQTKRFKRYFIKKAEVQS